MTAIVIGGLGFSPASANEPVLKEEPSQVLSESCESVVATLTESEVMQEALGKLDSEETMFTCMGGVATVEAQDDSGEPLATLVLDEDQGEIIDLTGLNDEEAAEIAPTVALGTVDEVEPSTVAPSHDGIMLYGSSTVNHQYRGSATDKIIWGEKRNGRTIWQESATVSAWISLQKTQHPVNVGYVSRRAIDMTIPTRFRTHLRALPDPKFAPTIFSPFGSKKSWNQTNYMEVSGAGKFYVELYGMSLYDSVVKKNYKIAFNITLPRFQCYKTVVCKYPNGKVAPY